MSLQFQKEKKTIDIEDNLYTFIETLHRTPLHRYHRIHIDLSINIYIHAKNAAKRTIYIYQMLS